MYMHVHLPKVYVYYYGLLLQIYSILHQSSWKYDLKL